MERYEINKKTVKYVQTTDSHQANRLPRGSYVWTVIEPFYAAISI